MADRIFNPATYTPNAQDFDGSWHTFGTRTELDTDANLIGGSAYLPNPMPATMTWVVYRVSDQSLIAEVNLAALSGTTPGAWNDFTSADFVTPGGVPLDSLEEYFVATASDGDFVYRDSGLAYPYGDGIIHGTEAGFFNGGTGPEFPDSFTSAFGFFADMLVQASGGPVAATGQSTAVAGTSSTASKVALSAGQSTAAAAATSTTMKVVRVTATCSAAAGTTSAAAKHATATGRTTAIATAYKASTDIRAVTAVCSAIATTSLRRRRVIPRPNTGVIVRPNTGIVLRP